MDDSSCICFSWLHTIQCHFTHLCLVPLCELDGHVLSCHEDETHEANGTMLPSSMKQWCGQFLKASIFKLLRWQIFPPPPEKAISRLITVRCDLNCISLEMTWWQEGMWLRMRKYYTDLHSNSLSGSETDDSELEKNETTKDRVSVSAYNKLEFPFAQLIYMGITSHA